MMCQPSASISSYQTGDRSHNTIPVIQASTQKRKYYHGIRKIKSKGAIVVLILAFLTYGTFFTVGWMCGETQGTATKDGPGAAAVIILTLSCPLAGWLADVYFGRYKVMRAGLWIMWIGTLYGAIVVIFYTQYDTNNSNRTFLNIAGAGLAIILVVVGFTGFAANALQFGLDQIPDASAEEMSALIHWFVWAILAGEALAMLSNSIYNCYPHKDNHYPQAIQSLLPAAMISLALCCEFLFRGWLTIEPESQNPLKTVSGVLKYAATHNRAERPSAFTYCEDERPSRIDFAKAKYGGPFNTEQVEDVKTCGRMLVVIVLTAVLLIPIDVFLISRSTFRRHLNKQIQGLTTCLKSVVLSSYSEAVFVTISIPIYEVLIYPLVRNRVPSMLQRIGIGVALTIILNLILLLIDTIGHTDNPSASCMFNVSSISLGIDYNWVGALSNFLVAIQLLLYIVALLEFTLAQAPYNIKGFLVGLAHSLIFSTFPIGYGIFVAWHTKYKLIKHWKPSCGFWFFLSQVLYAIVGLGILCIVAKRYKKRQRDEVPYDRAVLEAVYCK